MAGYYNGIGGLLKGRHTHSVLTRSGKKVTKQIEKLGNPNSLPYSELRDGVGCVYVSMVGIRGGRGREKMAEC